MKETLRKALEGHVACKTLEVKYGDTRRKCMKDVPACDVFIAGLPCVCVSSSLVKRNNLNGVDASQGLMYHRLLYVVAVEKLPEW